MKGIIHRYYGDYYANAVKAYEICERHLLVHLLCSKIIHLFRKCYFINQSFSKVLIGWLLIKSLVWLENNHIRKAFFPFSTNQNFSMKFERF